MRNGLKWLANRFDFAVAGKWLFLGVLIGVACGVASIFLQFAIQIIRELCLTALIGLDLGGPAGEPSEFDIEPGAFIPYLVVLVPAIGALISGALVFWLAPEAEGHGTDSAIDAYHRKLGRIRARVPLVKMVASAITIGTGGSGGREGPIAQIGAGFGSFLATRLRLSSRSRRMMLAAGIGGGVGAIFRAPLAGAIFAAEVLYSSSEVEAEVILPAMVSSIVGYAVYASRFGWGHMFSLPFEHGFTNPLELGPYLVLALVVALAALLFIVTFEGARSLSARMRVPRAFRAMLGGAVTGLIGLVLITVFRQTRDVGDVLSGGYGIIQHVIDTDGEGIPVLLLLAVGLGKIVTTSASIGSGGSGGVFGPSMVIGAALGAAVGKIFHGLMPEIVLHPTTFAIVGMAGFFTAAANTPISTVIMVSELTGDYGLLVPSMWVCTFAFLICRDWTIYGSQLSSRASALPQLGATTPQIFSNVRVGDVFRRKRRFVRIKPEMSIHEVMQAAEETRQRVFPITLENGVLVGAFRIEQLVHAIEQGDIATTKAADLLEEVTFFVVETDSLDKAQRMLRNNNLEELLVVESDAEKRVSGILTMADVLLAYQRIMGETTLERRSSEAPSRTASEAPSAKG
ncbi:MAG: chloride channel protein [Deltaproteobacteria bacterium]|nr:chloride channel protein [Deltaproteobacteria bacterium]